MWVSLNLVDQVKTSKKLSHTCMFICMLCGYVDVSLSQCSWNVTALTLKIEAKSQRLK